MSHPTPLGPERLARACVLAALMVAGPALPALAAENGPPPMPPRAETAEAGEEIDLEALFNTQVEVATKRAQSLSEAPAVVDVITDEDLRERGYNSVGEALRAVPGFYVVDDHFIPSAGVRGIPSGQRAWSRIVKVMIDGVPVPYLPDGSNFLGPELIPMQLIKRIEIIRGPASALYGADAFLGVINVVTKRGDDMAGANLRTQGTLRGGHPGGQAELVAGYPAPWREGEAVAGVLAGHTDQSGYGVPASSPSAAKHAGQTAQNDVATPSSFFARVGSVPTPIGLLAVNGGFQHVDAGGEFQDFHAFSHDSHVSLENRFFSASTRGQIGDKLSTSANVGYSRGNPGVDDVLDTGSPDHTTLRSLDSQGLTAAVEGSYAFDSHNSLTAGVDFAHDTHQLPTYTDLLRSPPADVAGMTRPDGTPGTLHDFDNLGLYSQGILYLLEDTAVTVGVRLDRHSVYGDELNSRVGLVSPLFAGLNGKLLYGSSFKAPSPQQLFGQPLIFGDILGNAALKPEKAQTVEGALLYSPVRNLDLLTNAYYTHVTDKIGFQTQGGNSKAVNQSQLDSIGLEAEAQWRWRWLHGNLNMSVQTTAALDQDAGNASADQTQRPEAYPTFMANAGVGAPLFNLPFTLYLEGRYVSDVAATQNNFVTNGLTDYALPASFLADFTIASKPWTLGDGLLTSSLKLSNILDAPDAQPGFGGVDYPVAGRTLMLRLDYAW